MLKIFIFIPFYFLPLKRPNISFSVLMFPQFLASNPPSPNHHLTPLNPCSYQPNSAQYNIVYLCKLLCLKCVTHTQSPFCKNSTTLLPLPFSPGTPKELIMPALVLSPIRLFKSPRMHNLYLFSTLSRVLSSSPNQLSSKLVVFLNPIKVTHVNCNLSLGIYILKILKILLPNPLYFNLFYCQPPISIFYSV